MVIKDAINFINEVRVELSKVSWPKWDEFVGSTLVVLFIVALCAVYLGSLDFIFSSMAKYLFSQGN